MYNSYGKFYDVGVVVGRFQNFHLGHQKLVDTSLALCDRLLIVVGSSQEFGTERNPYSITTRIDMIKEVVGYDPRVTVVALADLTHENDNSTEWGYYLMENIKKYIYKNPELMVYGNDESRSTWFSPEDIANTTELIINRNDLPISATKVRAAMVKNDRISWMKMVDSRLHKMYDRLRGELMNVEWYKNLENRPEWIRNDDNNITHMYLNVAYKFENDKIYKCSRGSKPELIRDDISYDYFNKFCSQLGPTATI